MGDHKRFGTLAHAPLRATKHLTGRQSVNHHGCTLSMAIMPSVRCPQYGSSKDFQGLGDFLSWILYHLSAGRSPV
jgi:hypothetical protein